VIDGRIYCERIVAEHLWGTVPRIRQANLWESRSNTFITVERDFLPVVKDLPARIHGHGKCVDKLAEMIEGRVG